MNSAFEHHRTADPADPAASLRILSRLAHPADGAQTLPYPDRSVIARVTELFLDLLFPVHRDRAVKAAHDIEPAVHRIGKTVRDLLAPQIQIAQRHRQTAEMPPASHEQIVTHLFHRLIDIRQRIAEDMEAAYQGDPAAKGPDEVIVSYPTFSAVGTYRIAHELHLSGLPFIPRMMTEYAHRRTGIDIHPGADIGRSFFIDHGTGVVIGETTDIGDRVRLYQGVTLGAANFPKDATGALIRGRKRHPTIQDDVTIYANATILGGETVIGRRSVIGSNVWLIGSIPPDSVVTAEQSKLRIKTRN